MRRRNFDDVITVIIASASFPGPHIVVTESWGGNLGTRVFVTRVKDITAIVPRPSIQRVGPGLPCLHLPDTGDSGATGALCQHDIQGEDQAGSGSSTRPRQ